MAKIAAGSDVTTPVILPYGGRTPPGTRTPAPVASPALLFLAWAKQLGLSEAKGLLQETLVEKENTDEVLSELAEDVINPAASA